jgi:DNA polymerase-3 subunit delta
MKHINEHIKQKQFSPVYLLYGEESYLKRLYRNRLQEAVLGDGDPMNSSYFQGKGTEEKEVREIADTLPFFAKRRVVVVEESGWFKKQSDFADYIPELPPSTVLIFVEAEVDKRNRLYKAVNKQGTVSEMKTPSEKDLKLWVASGLKRSGKKLTEQTIEYLLERVGTDMELLQQEIEKLVCYAYEREVITKEDIQAVCVEQITGKVFQMMEAIGMKQQERALGYYYDLLALRESPLSILFLTLRQFHLLRQAKELNRLHTDSKTIAARLKIPPFTVSRYLAQARNFPSAVLKEAIEYGLERETEVKTGRLDGQLAVELLILRYSS